MGKVAQKRSRSEGAWLRRGVAGQRSIPPIFATSYALLPLILRSRASGVSKDEGRGLMVRDAPKGRSSP